MGGLPAAAGGGRSDLESAEGPFTAKQGTGDRPSLYFRFSPIPIDSIEFPANTAVGQPDAHLVEIPAGYVLGDVFPLIVGHACRRIHYV